MTSICSAKCFSQFVASLLLTPSLLLCWATPGSAQYLITDLVSNQNAIGSNPVDLDLVNAWGVTSLATSPFWVSDNGSGKSTLYNSLGQKQGLVVASIRRFANLSNQDQDAPDSNVLLNSLRRS